LAAIPAPTRGYRTTHLEPQHLVPQAEAGYPFHECLTECARRTEVDRRSDDYCVRREQPVVEGSHVVADDTLASLQTLLTRVPRADLFARQGDELSLGSW